MDSDSLYLALAEDDWYVFILPSKPIQWAEKQNKDCRDKFRTDSKNSFSPHLLLQTEKKHDKREPGLFKEEFRCTEMLCLYSISYWCQEKLKG